MARNSSLDAVIGTLFNDSNIFSQTYRYRNVDDAPVTSKKYMEIPINSETFELPLLAFTAFREMIKSRSGSDMLVAQLFSCGVTSSYKSLDAIMRDSLSTEFSKHLVKVVIPGSSTVYYATFGTVFDSNFKPLMMLSWIMDRVIDSEGKTKYSYVRPLLRINPEVCVNKEDALQRFIAGKMMTTALSKSINRPYFYDFGDLLDQTDHYTRRLYSVKVEIDESPFYIKEADVPSISVTNKDLLQLATLHIDEVMQ